MPTSVPKISIITPSFNQGRFIEQTIRSVLDQQYPNLEYIVVDGGSTDETLAILKKYQNRVRWISEKDRGQSDAINKGLRLSSGEIIGYLNSDDLLLPGSLKAVSDCFEQHPNAAWVTGYCRNINQDNKVILPFISQYKNFLLRHFHPNTFLMINYISQMSTFWRRSAMERVGKFSVSQHLVMDYDFWLRLLQLGRPKIIRVELSCFRLHPGAKSTQRFAQQFEESYRTAKPHINRAWLLALSWLHNKLVVAIYSLQSRQTKR